MNRFAFDLVLLPPSPLLGRVIQINKELRGVKPHPISFDKSFPHITLAQGVIRKNDLDKVKTAIGHIADTTEPLKLKISRGYEEPLPTGETIFGLEIQLTDKLKKLHKNIMEALKPYVTYDAGLEDLFDRDAEPQTLNWINGFRDNSSGGKFWPHITVGVGEGLVNAFVGEILTASELALFHLGTYCTCPKTGKFSRWVLRR